MGQNLKMERKDTDRQSLHHLPLPLSCWLASGKPYRRLHPGLLICRGRWLFTHLYSMLPDMQKSLNKYRGRLLRLHPSL